MRVLIVILLILIFGIGCSTPQERIVETIPEAPKVEPIIEEVHRSPELSKKPILRNRISKALEDCKKYGEDVMAKFNSCIDNSNRQASLIAKYKADVVKLEEEVWQWRKIKYTAYAILTLGVIVLLGRLLLPVIMGIIRKGAGLP